MIKKIKAKIRTFLDSLRGFLSPIVIEYTAEDMDNLKKRHGLESMSDEAAVQQIFDDLMRDRRSLPRSKNSYEKGQSV